MSRFALLPLALLLLASLALVGAWPPADSLAGKLADDGRAGTVMDVQGSALVRPAGRTRWTPLGPKSVLFPGDIVRTAARGANAVEWQNPEGTLLLGPGTLMEVKHGSPRLLRGEVEATAKAGRIMAVQAGDEVIHKLNGSAWFRAAGKTHTTLEKAPRWVEGYRASASNEWMGSLLAKVDGRDVPLAVGYHKVDVEVRDQIARTTVEQSFVNSTSQRLEGVFYFPLPADASISGFGMWIGGELVEADIVERQRARQIYEDILRRKKDPGLLEWEGGNIFKARVFPIFPHAEKRIRIRYTQVLPMSGSSWRYRYALRSELLRSKPVRELKIAVRVVSDKPLVEIASPTHECLVDRTKHEATVEFSASEFRPENDFEVVARVDGTRALTAVPHRRGEDGYFLLLLSPPDEAAGEWQRELVPEGTPLHVTFVADTSGSMDAKARANQADFIAAVLDQFGPEDRFRLLAADALAVWLTPEAKGPVFADEALTALAARRSLGWSDIDGALGAAFEGAPDGSLVVYVGDGVGTTGDADPVALAERIRNLGKDRRVGVHAVASSSSYESGVLAAMASIGGGSVRTIGQNPGASAYELLAEVARPAVRNLRVEIEGLRTARIYPQALPNLPVGAQQVVLGRYLPSETEQAGRVLVSGTRDGKPVRYAAELRAPAADGGNSFLPRLWGRRHIDALLDKGGSAEVAEEIIAFSERFGIMTPYTSFLVLESDEDRERYGVERRVRMRDGERFFAEARDKATLEARRAQMKAAGRWRLEMRRNALKEIARLGRDLPIHTPPHESVQLAHAELASNLRGPLGSSTRAAMRSTLRDSGVRLAELARGGGASGGDWGGERLELAAPAAAVPPPGSAPVAGGKRGRGAGSAHTREPADPTDSVEDLEESFDAPPAEEDADGFGWRGGGRAKRRANRPIAGLLSGEARSSSERLSYRGRRWQPRSFTLQSLGFPRVPIAPKDPEGEPAGEPWDEEVVALLRRAIRRDAVRSVEGGLHFQIRSENLHASRGRVLGASTIEAWVGKAQWRLLRSHAGVNESEESWVQGEERGALARARRLARTRKAEDGDANAWWLPIWDLQVRDLIDAWRRQGYRAAVASRNDGRVQIVLDRPNGGKARRVLDIDPKRDILIEETQFDRLGRMTHRTRHSNPVQVAGRWWPQRVEHFDGEKRKIGRKSITVLPLTPGVLATRAQKATAQQTDVITIHGKLPKVVEAKQARHEGRAGFVEYLVLTLRRAQRQQWDPGLTAWAQAEALVKEKPGHRWIRAVLLSSARRGEAFRTYVDGLVPHVASARAEGRGFLAQLMWRMAHPHFGPSERGDLLDRLRSWWIDAERPAAASRHEAWLATRAQAHTQAGQHAAGNALLRQAAEAFPTSVSAQISHHDALWRTGRFEEAGAQLRRLLADREPWLATERNMIYARLADRLWERRRIRALHDALTVWLGHEPKSADPYWRWYSSLYFLGDEKVADEAVLAGLALRPGGDGPDAPWARARAAAQVAMGNGWSFSLRRIEKRFGKPLADLCLHTWRSDGRNAHLANLIHNNWRYRRTDAHRDLVRALRADIRADGAIESMPLDRLQRYIHWLPYGRNNLPEADWRSVVDRLLARWKSSEREDERERLGSFVLHLLDAQSRREEAIAFARERLERANGRNAAARAGDLYSRLLRTPVRDEHATPAREDEALALMPQLLRPDMGREAVRAEAARRAREWAAKVYTWRYERALGTPEERSPMTRAARKVLRRDARAATRKAMVSRLSAAEQSAGADYRPWMQLERLGYAVELGEDLEAIVGEAAAILGRDWKREDVPLDRLTRERAAVLLAYAVTRRNASDDLKEAVLQRLEAGRRAAPEGPAVIELLDWRYHIFRLLVALDRAGELEAALSQWIVPAKVDSRWRVALAYLQAETGRLAEAAAQFEAVHALGELAAKDYATLADWYLVLDDDAKREMALDARYDHMAEWQLSNLFWSKHRGGGRTRGGVPADFDPETLRVLRALMRKAQHPSNYWPLVRDLYRSHKDFRTLESIGDALVGHTKEGIYGFLGNLTRLAREIHEEATCDELIRHLAGLRAKAKRPLDRRALSLAVSLVEGRASHVPEADPAHGRRAVQALVEAFQQAWEKGERRLMATYLKGLGVVKDAATAAEQRRQLDALLAAEPIGSLERLDIAHALAETHWAYGRHGDALATIATAIGQTRAAHQERVPESRRAAFDSYVNWLGDRGRFADAERQIRTELEHWDLPHRRRGLMNFLFQVYVRAVRGEGSVSLGRGAALFEAAAAAMERDMGEDVPNLGAVLHTYCDLHDWGTRKIQPMGPRLETFGRERLPALLARVPLDRTSRVRTVATMIRKLSGPHAGLAFLLDRRDDEPKWLPRIDRDVWRRSAREFARWRHDAGRIGSLEPRLARLVLAQLEQHLLTGDGTGSWFWSRGNKWFWAKRERDYVTTTGRIAELNGSSEETLIRCANLLRRSLGKHREGLQVLLAAHANEVLGLNGRWIAANWLVNDKRYAEARPILEPLVAERPDELRYRLSLATALHGLGRESEAGGTLDATEKRLRERKIWSERAASQLGNLAVKLGYGERAARWMEEAIRMRQEARGYRGGRDSRLAGYYRALAKARGTLGQTKAAVQAAATAMLAGNANSRRERNRSRAALDHALSKAPALDNYIAQYEAEVEETGLDAPVIRKALARVLKTKGQTREALRHLLLARALDETDAEIHKAIVAAYDLLGDGDGAVEALFGSIRLAPQNLAAYRDLAQRYTKAGRKKDAERAISTLAEASPHQPDGHRALATEREAQDRRGEAAVQWRQVVRTDALDPTGWLSLARVLIKLEEHREARKRLEHVLGRSWEKRFGDVKKKAAALLAQLPENGSR